MKNRNQKELEDNFIEERLAEAFGYGDEQLANELDDAVAAAEENGCRAPEGELERIMNRLESRPVPRRKVVRIRRVVKTLIAAAVLGTMVIGGGMWVGAKRYYVYDIQERKDIDNMILSNNSDNLISDNNSEKREVYEQIQKELNIDVLELSYLPEKMIFRKLTMTHRRSVMEFSDGENNLFWVQGLSNKPSSLSYAMDIEKYQEAYNMFLEQVFPIYKEDLEDGRTQLSVRIVRDKTYYILYGVIDVEEFKQVISGIKPYRKDMLED